MPVASPTPRILVRRNGKLVAALMFGRQPKIHDRTEAPLIRALLAQERFVYNPATRQLRALGPGQRATRPDWWLCHMQEALWKTYDLSTEND